MMPKARSYNTGAEPGDGDYNDQVVGKRKRGRKNSVPGGGGGGAWEARSRASGLSYGTQEWVQGKIEQGDISGGMAQGHSGTSIFDPVLCEIVYRWFCPPDGLVLDPFAGGSVRGIVASHLGRRYLGVELREEQVDANRLQLPLAKDPAPEWRKGDSRNIATICADIEAQGADLIFSCPPYADLEVYSDDTATITACRRTRSPPSAPPASASTTRPFWSRPSAPCRSARPSSSSTRAN